MENPNQINQEQHLNDNITYLEKIMIALDPNATEENHKHYLAGVIDTLHDKSIISEETRTKLYEMFCF